VIAPRVRRCFLIGWQSTRDCEVYFTTDDLASCRYFG
jgi:hypothetical protein